MTEGRLLKPLPERNWRLYSRGQVQEVRLFDLLLADLVAPLAPPETMVRERGRPSIPAHELAWCAIKKAHTGYSSRRNQGHVLDAHQEGILGRAPRYNAVGEFLGREGTAAVLRGLVQASALPLAGIEHGFAVDSTGFTTCTFGTYKQKRYGEKKVDWRDWVKLHACVGVRTCIVTDAIVTAAMGEGSADQTNFQPLVEATARAFDMQVVTADAAYASKTNHWAAKQAGAEALIPFHGGKNQPSLRPRSAANQGAPGLPGSAKLWRRAFHYFKLNEEEFYARYHQRSNVEAAFGAIKQTLGERLKSKTETAQRNEVLSKVVAWNIRCVVRAMVELGVEPVFGNDPPARLFPSGDG